MSVSASLARTIWRNALAIAFLCFAVPLAAQLPPAVETDRLFVKADREIGEGEYSAAFDTLGVIIELAAEHDLELREGFWFKHAQVSLGARFFDQAISSATRYLQEAGQQGAYYMEALKLLDAVEQAKEKASKFARALPEMVRISAGSFRMGCVSGLQCDGDELKVRTVRISQPFELSKYEVTFAQWDVCVESGGCNRYVPDDNGWGRGNRPVINVSEQDAQAYVSWLSEGTGHEYRLPSEPEWEYAARAGSTTTYSWGNSIGINRANCDGCGSQWDDSQTAPVGSFLPNAWGLYDMHGNVWERTGSGVLRGGSWNFNPRYLRSANRFWDSTGLRFNLIGFRVARTLTP